MEISVVGHFTKKVNVNPNLYETFSLMDSYGYESYTANNELRKDICFKIPKVVDSCEDGKLLKGQVIASTVPSSEGIGTALAVSAPLEMKVNCNESSFNVLFFVVPFVLISTLFGIIQIMRYSKNRKYNKLYSELMYLQKIISSGKFNQSHVDRFNKIRSICTWLFEK